MNDEQKENVFVFLDNLRESGTINMFGAASYVAHAFEIGKTEARNLLTEWMQTFDERHPE